MKLYPVIGTGCASGVNRPKTEMDDKVGKAMAAAILKSVDDGCDEEEMKRRILAARDKCLGAEDVS